MPKQITHTEPEYFEVVENDIANYAIALFVKYPDSTYHQTYLLGEYTNKEANLDAANKVASKFKLGTWYRDEAMSFTKENAEQALHCVQKLLKHKTSKTYKQLLPKKCQVTIPVLYDTAGNPTCQTSKQKCPFFTLGTEHYFGGLCLHRGEHERLSRVPVKEGGRELSYHPCDTCPIHGKNGSATKAMKVFSTVLAEQRRFTASVKAVSKGLKKAFGN